MTPYRVGRTANMTTNVTTILTTTRTHNPLHDVRSEADKKTPIYPGTKMWRKTLKMMIKRKKADIEELVVLVANGTLKQKWVDEHKKSDRVELKMLTYAYYMDTRNTILEMKKFKVLKQKESAHEVSGVTILSTSDDGTTVSAKVVEGDLAYKLVMERMADDVHFYEEMCRSLIANDVF